LGPEGSQEEEDEEECNERETTVKQKLAIISFAGYD
jgi:hypothetical protein